MQRDVSRLTARPYDLLIIGGGIYGACAAWEAVRRGCSVALLEQADFGGATSANSQKIVHGGMRYLQTLDIKRMRESIRERRTLLRVAPHLVHPLPCVMPTYGRSKRSRAAMRLAFTLNDLMSWDRNRGIGDPARRVPAGRLLSREECLRLAPGVIQGGLTGGALWYDGQACNSERLTLAFVRSAAELGAEVANYVRVTDLLRDGDRVIGVRAEDVVTGRTLEVAARHVLNASGPWVERLLAPLNGRVPHRATRFLKAMSLVTRPLDVKVAVGVENRSAAGTTPGLLFITPWRDVSVIGTSYRPYDGDPQRCGATEEEIGGFLSEVNRAYPTARLRREDVRLVHVGLVPASCDGVGIEPHYRLIDHERNGVRGLVSVLGIKYTTARDVAEKAVVLICRKLRMTVSSDSAGRTKPLPGGDIASVDGLLRQAMRERPLGIGEDVMQRLVCDYGTGYRDILAIAQETPTSTGLLSASTTVLKAQIVHAVRSEMAVTLADVVFRRTGLGTAGRPGDEALRACATVMAEACGWDASRVERELADVEHHFVRYGALRREPVEVGV